MKDLKFFFFTFTAYIHYTTFNDFMCVIIQGASPHVHRTTGCPLLTEETCPVRFYFVSQLLSLFLTLSLCHLFYSPDIISEKRHERAGKEDDDHQDHNCKIRNRQCNRIPDAFRFEFMLGHIADIRFHLLCSSVKIDILHHLGVCPFCKNRFVGFYGIQEALVFVNAGFSDTHRAECECRSRRNP